MRTKFKDSSSFGFEKAIKEKGNSSKSFNSGNFKRMKCYNKVMQHSQEVDGQFISQTDNTLASTMQQWEEFATGTKLPVIPGQQKWCKPRFSNKYGINYNRFRTVKQLKSH